MLLQTQPSSFPVKPLGELIAGFEAGVNYPPVSETDSASPWRVLKISAVTWGEFNPKESKPIKSNTSFTIVRTELRGYKTVGTQVFVVGVGFNQSWVQV